MESIRSAERFLLPSCSFDKRLERKEAIWAIFSGDRRGRNKVEAGETCTVYESAMAFGRVKLEIDICFDIIPLYLQGDSFAFLFFFR